MFLEGDCEFVVMDLSKSINEQSKNSEKILYDAICKQISTNTKKKKTDGETNLETATTKAAMTISLIANEVKEKKN